MKKLLLSLIAFATVLFADFGTVSPGGYLTNLPTYTTCAEITDLSKRPTLTAEAAAAVDADGNQKYILDPATVVDVANGLVMFRVISGDRDNVVEELVVPTSACSFVDAQALENAKNVNIAGIQQKIDTVLASIPEIAQNAVVDDNNTLAASTADAFMLKTPKNTQIAGGRQPFFADFFAGIKDNYNRLLNFIVVVCLAFGLIFLSIAGATGRLENWGFTTRFIVGIFVVLMFFVPTASETSRVHSIFGFFVKQGTNFANFTTGKASIAEAKYSLNYGAVGALKERVEEATKHNLILAAQSPANAAILVQCANDYDIALLRSESSNPKKVFPMTLAEAGVKSETEFLFKYFKPLQNGGGSFVAANPYYSREACAVAEESFARAKQMMKENLALIQKASQTNLSQLGAYTQTSIQTSNNNGWVGIVLLPAQRALVSGQDSPIAANNNPKFDWKHPLDSVSSWSFQGMIDGMMGRAALMYVPGTHGVYDVSKDVVKANISIMSAAAAAFAEATKAAADSTGEVAKTIAGGGIASGIAAGASAAVAKGIEILKESIPQIAAFFISTTVAQALIDSLVYIVIVGVGAVVVAFWHFEVLMFTLALPFVTAYAFAQNQHEAMIDIAKKGLAIAFKPVLIVISIMAAVYCADLFHSISFDLITKQNSMLVAHNDRNLNFTANNGMNVLGMFSDLVSWVQGAFLNAFIKGIILIIGTILEIFLMVTIITKGPSTFLNFLNIQNADATNLTDNITQKTARYESGV